MENIINSIEPKQFDLGLQTFKISDKFTIYKTFLKDVFEKKDFIDKVELNKNLYYKSNISNNHSLTLNIECPEFKFVDCFFIETIQKIKNKKIDKNSKFSWVYTQTKDFSAEWMHNHKNLHRFNKSHLNTEFVCVFYIQVPPNMKKGEGDLLFLTENKEYFSFTPQENDVIIFSGEIEHMTTPCQNSNEKRISYVSNFNFLKDE